MIVLIVDDSDLVRNRMRRLLESFPSVTAVLEASGVGEAADVLKEAGPDIVVLDLDLSGESGFDVVGHAAGLRKKPAFIVLTNHASDFFRKKSERLGIKYFFDKSTEFVQAGEIIRRLSAESSPA